MGSVPNLGLTGGPCCLSVVTWEGENAGHPASELLQRTVPFNRPGLSPGVCLGSPTHTVLSPVCHDVWVCAQHHGSSSWRVGTRDPCQRLAWGDVSGLFCCAGTLSAHEEGVASLVNRMLFLRVWHCPCYGDMITTAGEMIGPGSLVQSSASVTRSRVSGPRLSLPGWWPERERELELRRTHTGHCFIREWSPLSSSLSGERIFVLSLLLVFSAYFLFLFNFIVLILLL